jgi:hypothetical protein
MFSSHFPAKFKAVSATLLLLTLNTMQGCGIPVEQGGSDGSSSQLVSSDGDDATNPEFAYEKTLIINAEKIDGSTDFSLSSVSLVSLTSDFREISDGNLPEWDVTRSDETRYDATGNAILNIATDYVEQINHVIKIQYSDEEIYYAAIPYIPTELNSTAEVTVNIFTHYMISKLFDQIPDSETLLTHLPCQSGDPVIGCNNQPRAKQDYLSLINNTAAEFNLEIPSSSTIDQALAIIDSQDDIRRFAETAIQELVQTAAPFAKGTMREVTGLGFDNEGNVFSTPPPWSKTYNSVFLGLSLSDIEPNDTVPAVKYGASNSTIVENRELANELAAYPKYQSTTYLTDIRREAALFIDIPFERTTLTASDINAFEVDRSEPINTYASEYTPDSFLSREGNILEGRSLVPTQPGSVADIKDVAWQYEPAMSKLYQANEYEPDSVYVPADEETSIDYGNEPTWLTGGTYTNAANYRVINPETEEEELGEQLEEINLFSWELHGLQTSTAFTAGQLSGKSYGVISFSQKLNPVNTVNEVFGETMVWNATNSLFSIEQPVSSEHYRSHTISRNADNGFQALQTQRNIVESTRSFFDVATEVADQSSETGVSEQNRGLLKLDGGIEAPIGHATENGSYFAFSFNTSDTESVTDRGTGIIVGTELNTVNPVFPDPGDSVQAIYQLQGNSVGIMDNTNNLQNLNGSTLHITNRAPDETDVDCHATLQLSRLYVTHTFDSVSNKLSPVEYDSQSNIESTSCRITFNEIEIGFPEVLGQDLTLKGFMSKPDNELSIAPGNLITMLWLQENSIGLVFAGKAQSLNAGFE